MTVTYAGNGLYVGLSSDTKPTAPSGYRFLETDIGDMLISDGTYWWLNGSPSPFSTRRFGYFSMSASATVGAGMLGAFSTATGAGSQNFALTDSANGRFITGITGTTTGNKGGWRIASILSARRWNIRMRFRFKLVSTTLQRAYLGFFGTSNPPTEPTGDDPFNGANLQGFCFGCISGATNFEIISNDNADATVVTSTGTALDTNVHTVSLVGDEDNSRFSWKLDSGSYNHISTAASIPTSAGSLSVCFQNETNESGVAKSFQLYNAFVQSDK